MEYKEYELGELIEYRNEKLLIENVSLENYISTENLLPNRSGKQNAEKLPNTKSVKKYYENDILISNIRPYFKKIWQAEIPGGASNDVLILNSCSNKVTNDYLYYYLSQDKFFDYMTQTAKGTKMPRGDKKAILDYEIKVPNIKHIQNYIVNLGKNIDKKIETNKKIIANLEELSQTLFKRWFVDFEFPDENGNPYKSSGGEMIDSELGEIPDGWNVKNLKDIAFCQNGYAFYKLGYSNSGYFAVDLGNININSQFVYTNKDKFISKDIIDEKKEKFILNKNDLVMVMTDRTQEMNILGRTARIPKSNKYVLNQRIFRLRAKNKHILTYLQAMLNSVEIRNQLKMKSLGSAQKYINTKHITELSIKCPDNELIKNFYRSCENYFIKSEMLNEEIEKLTQLRDTLLPKLMSGEIEIPDDIEVNEDELSI
ncbi:Type I restriction-modification system,specificity subunit S [Staphylococcus aureus]|nr:Type I restriction-modification system,specificity subunit S [Staphylococcus aureus]CAC5937670.1 Type I restriction-modification system,specificity subunit S [Staphylococcus aureus]HDC5170944.1 restriction endonuclease subunit S [Staphylococcus aureus]HEI7831272.1 restriction endonuclease subunit S [Staphylococcus aureus]